MQGCSRNDHQTLTLAVAANMQFVMQTLVETFSTHTGIECVLVTGSSGKLMAQIKSGAPYDIFLSADMKYPKELYHLGFTTTTPKVYAYGQLVLWSMIEGLHPSLDILLTEEVKHIAIANEKIAPYGRAATEVMKNSHTYQALKDKLIYGESIAQTNQFIVSQAAEIGFTAMSVVMSEKMREKGTWVTIEGELYNKIEQGVVVIANERALNKQALQFYDFIFSQEAQRILHQFGYETSK